MNVYKKRSLISILTMALVIGLLSTALAVTTDGNHRRNGSNGDGRQHKGHSGKGNNRRAGINSHNGNVDNNNRVKQARTGRGKTTPVEIPASTSVTVAPTGNSENADADHHLNGKGTDVTQLKGHSDDNAKSEITSVKVPASTSVTAAATGNSENTDADHHLNGKGTDVTQLKGHSDEGNNQRAYINNLNIDTNNNNRGNHAQSETFPVKIPTSTSDTAAPTES